ncbi:hypothetical protein [Halothiobacillus sp. DCM-1]|uniref:hypothetical protein n=1 Tax=Halothiobacillus sp. DCM-1 TaxID=3112558 RepID=UPI00324B88C1
MLASMKFLRRIFVVVTCYLLSLYGLVFSIILIGTSGTKSLLGAIVGIAILVAWVIHIIMSINWVIDRAVQPYIPVWGSIAGTFGLIFWPFALAANNYAPSQSALQAIIMGLVFTAPCFLLAIYLVQFHLRIASKNATPIS